MGEEGASNFKSFKDLLKARGGTPPADQAPDSAPQPPSGPNAADYEEKSVEEFVSEYGDRALEETSRERIARRPDAFGPMEHGPAVYRDESSEEMSLLSSFRLRTLFPADVLAEVEALPFDPL
ncbi:MAG: hypothetical protein ACKO32_14680, partial [Planctomycetia bacterium]